MIHNQLAGYFTVTVHNADGSVKEEHSFPNLITDFGMNAMGSVRTQPPALRNCQVGTGSTPPTVADTALASFLAVTEYPQSPVHGYNSTDDYHWRRWTYRFNQGAAAGNLTEIGIGWIGSAAGNLWSRALIVDTAGQPTTLTITANEFLTVTYELRNYVKHGDIVTTAMVDGVSRTITIRPCLSQNPSENWANLMPLINAYGGGQTANYDGIDACEGAIVAETGEPTGKAYLPQSSRVWGPYTPGSFYVECTSTIPINYANFSIKSLVLSCGIGKFQFGIVPPIVKDNTMEVRVTLGVRWSRYTP